MIKLGKELNKKISFIKTLIVSSSFLLIGYAIGYFFGDNIYTTVITPFENSEGIFDYSIFWTAILGFGTLVLGFIVYKSTSSYQKEVSLSSSKHQSQIEKLTKLNLDLTDKLLHLETFKYYPQVKMTLAENSNMQKYEHIQLYCNTKHFYNINMTKGELESQVAKIVCQLENVGESYIDEIIFNHIVIIIKSNDNEKRIVYQGKPENTGCSSLFINSNKNLIFSFQRSLLKRNDIYMEILTHYIVKNGKQELWVTDWINHIYVNLPREKIVFPAHCTSTRLNNKELFNEEVIKVLNN